MSVIRVRHPLIHGVTRAVFVPTTTASLYLLSPLTGVALRRDAPFDENADPVAIATFDRPVDIAVADSEVWVADAYGLHRLDADLVELASFALEEVTAIAYLGDDDLIAVAFGDGRIETRTSVGTLVSHFASPWVFDRLLWTSAGGLVGVTDDARVVSFDVDLTVLLTADYQPERTVPAIRNLRTAVLWGAQLVMVGADRFGRGSVTTLNLTTGSATSDRELARSIILAASVISVGTALQPASVSWMPWHIPVVGLTFDDSGADDVEAAIGQDEVWITVDGNGLTARHILAETFEHITTEADDRLVWE